MKIKAFKAKLDKLVELAPFDKKEIDTRLSTWLNDSLDKITYKIEIITPGGREIAIEISNADPLELYELIAGELNAWANILSAQQNNQEPEELELETTQGEHKTDPKPNPPIFPKDRIG